LFAFCDGGATIAVVGRQLTQPAIGMLAVGFLGAGVIVRSEKRHHVQGLTTAACVWVTACMGAACAIAQWQIVVIGVVLILVILDSAGVSKKWSIDAGRLDGRRLRICRPIRPRNHLLQPIPAKLE